MTATIVYTLILALIYTGRRILLGRQGDRLRALTQSPRKRYGSLSGNPS